MSAKAEAHLVKMLEFPDDYSAGAVYTEIARALSTARSELAALRSSLDARELRRRRNRQPDSRVERYVTTDRPRLHSASTPMTPQPTSRWWDYAHNRMVKCSSGHHIKSTARFNETGFIRCAHWLAADRAECGRWVFVFAIRGSKCIIAEVSLDEQEEMEQLATPSAMLDYLGIFDRQAS